MDRRETKYGFSITHVYERIYKTKIDSQRTYGFMGKEGWQGIGWEFGNNSYTLLYLK